MLFGGHLRTDFDTMLDIILQQDSTSLKDLCKQFNLDSRFLYTWFKGLREHGLVCIKHSLFDTHVEPV